MCRSPGSEGRGVPIEPPCTCHGAPATGLLEDPRKLGPELGDRNRVVEVKEHRAEELGLRSDQGKRYSWGYPACPEQSEHEKVFRLLDAPSIGLRLSDGYALEPEQSTLAVISHHPQAVYFGMKSGFLPKSDKQASDELIAGTDKDPARLAELPDEDPDATDAGEPAMAGA